MRRRGIALLTFGFIEGTARAQGDGATAEPIGIAYAAPAGCPDSFAFFREVAARTTRVRAARREEPARVLRVAVTAASPGFAGSLAIEDATGGRSAPREVRGATCEEVVQTLGLIGALTLDPKASTETASEAPAPPPPPAPSPPASAEVTPEPPAPPPPPPVPPEIVPSPTPAIEGRPHEPDAVPAGERPSRLRFGVGTQFEGAFVADFVAAMRFFAEVERNAPRGELWAPSLRLGAFRSVEASQAASAGSASLQWTAATIEPCPVRFSLAPELTLRPCGGLELGALGADGSGVANSRSRSRPWVTASGQLRLMWEITAGLALEIESGALVPFVRDDFYFAPGIPVYTAPAVAFLSRGGLSVHFP